MWVLLDRLLFDFSPSTFVWSELGYLPLYVALFMGFEFLQERMKDLEPWLKLPALGRAAVYSSAIYGIALLAPEKTLGFIYFAF